ncbi:MAG TPA: exodeoxyribonuclease VII large subunit, partial [Brevundimonas sp.]|nr:exodeoxyribonuclease VII large subunit [Brevundimonas sp.]
VPPRALDRGTQSLITLSRALNSLNPRTPKPGFARVEAGDGQWLTAAGQIAPGQALGLVFADGQVDVRAEGGTAPEPAPPPPPAQKTRRVAPPPPDQGDLF